MLIKLDKGTGELTMQNVFQVKRVSLRKEVPCLDDCRRRVDQSTVHLEMRAGLAMFDMDSMADTTYIEENGFDIDFSDVGSLGRLHGRSRSTFRHRRHRPRFCRRRHGRHLESFLGEDGHVVCVEL